ncbi:methionyl-tRNA formyltransferase [Halobacillus litoralis]|uniref:Methionyl-tRNA formyltransferase n=1 Tax=Halobacillus litoralis TaxID=45668 RepID=A0A845DNE5_9BACI|nr:MULTISPECIES: methionyl-tRNA formyltransferase [Halobacillus]MCA1023333.1 methionyl-tRNA formyltransferase [Halobacillus litoralis]MYL19131.1 methionyl-tRNA formyltransferase [Halobacillus litoralis]MYL28277.1 methionyl-tRNA formyltransferase [Halobacillus halophilus]MYL37791.1 methionyl-tRNA formyltransferase [Halobacillus litoralis]
MTRIAFMGTPDFAVPVLDRIMKEGYEVVVAVTQPDRPKGRKKVMTPPPVKTAALNHGIPVLQPEKIKNEYEDVLAYQPDLIVTAAFGQILPEALLNVPEYGCINVHASLLPEFRGGAPIHYSILEGKKETGVTIMYMVKKLDAGDMLSKVVVPIEDTDHVGTLHDKLSAAGADLLADTLPDLLAGKITPEVQDESKVTFAGNIKREQELIDWSRDQQAVYNHVRGLHPWPVAYTYWNGKPLKIWWAEKVSGNFSKPAGTVVKIEEDGFLVQTGEGKALKIVSLQPSGKKKMDGQSFVNGAGQSLNEGDVLGEQHG